MKRLSLSCFLMSGSLLCSGCFEVNSYVTNQYMINAYDNPHYRHPIARSIHVNPPNAVTSIDSTQMLYATRPYETLAFAHNAWTSPPSDMLYPAIIQSLNKSHAFKIVTSGVQSGSTQYTLNIQLLTLIQNFFVHPSHLQFAASVSLTEESSQRILATKMFRYEQCCPYESPYGGVLAANQIAKQFTKDITLFVVRAIKPAKRPHRVTMQTILPRNFASSSWILKQLAYDIRVPTLDHVLVG